MNFIVSFYSAPIYNCSEDVLAEFLCSPTFVMVLQSQIGNCIISYYMELTWCISLISVYLLNKFL